MKQQNINQWPKCTMDELTGTFEITKLPDDISIAYDQQGVSEFWASKKTLEQLSVPQQSSNDFIIQWDDIQALYTIVERAFAKKVDKAGSPYIGHCAFVAQYAYQLGQQYAELHDFKDHQYPKLCYIVGLCHDVIEDCDQCYVDEVLDCIRERFNKYLTSSIIIAALQILTRRDDEKYSAYMKRIETNLLAMIVKCADTKHNSMFVRFKDVPERKMEGGSADVTIDRCLKYYKQYVKLYSKIFEIFESPRY